MRKLLGLLLLLVSIGVIGLACSGSEDEQEVAPATTESFEPTVVSHPVLSENEELNALLGKVPEPCYAGNTTEVFSATGAIAIYNWDSEGYSGGGTGVVLNGYVVTARHVVDKNLKNYQPILFLYVPGEEEIAPIRTDIIYSDPEYDFSILELDDTSAIYEETRSLVDSFHVTTLDGEIPEGLLCFFRFIYPPENGRVSIVPLPGEYTGNETNVFAIIPGQDFMFESPVGGLGASGSPVFVKSSDGSLVLAGIIKEVVNFIEVQGDRQAQSAYHFALDINLICQRALENANIDLCGYIE